MSEPFVFFESFAVNEIPPRRLERLEVNKEGI